MTTTPYRTALAAALGTLLPAALIVGALDALHTGTRGAALPVLGVWSLVTLPVAVACGIVLGACTATWGADSLRRFGARLRMDRSFDRAVLAALLVAVTLASTFAVVAGLLADTLVGDLRTSAGGWFELALVGLLGVGAVLGIPLWRALRRALQAVPIRSPLAPAALLATGIAAAAAACAGLWIACARPAEPSSSVGPAAVPVVAILLAGLAFGPLDRLRRALPRRGLMIGALTGLLATLSLVTLSRDPSPDVRDGVVERSAIGGPVVLGLRSLIDRDGDAFSGLFGGPDCDDTRPDVHPGAAEIPGNHLDDNCFGGDAKPPAPPPRKVPATAAPAAAPIGGQNLVILFVDTLRFDRLGVSGYRRKGKSLTPRLDAFAAGATVFRRAYAQAPATLRSAPSFLASRYPSQLAVDRAFADYPTMLEDNELLFEVMQPAGFRTIGESSHFYFCDDERFPQVCNDFPRRMRSNVLQGADEWDNAGAVDIHPSNRDIAGPRIVEKTIARLRQLAAEKRRFAMLVHLFDPHSTYMVHPEWPVTTRGELGLAEKYDYEIAFEDRMIGQLLDALDATGLAATTTVALISDHGEAFGVHSVGGERMFFHGQTLYRELLHVPLMFRVPGLPGRVVDDVVELVDFAPTITDLFGLARPASWVGRSLRPLIEGHALAPRPAFAELIPAPWWNREVKSMITADGTRHLVYRVTKRRWELYDLIADPHERVDIFRTDPRALELQRELQRWIEGPLAEGGGSCQRCASP